MAGAAHALRLNYCKFGVNPSKPTAIWTNIESMIAELQAQARLHLLQRPPVCLWVRPSPEARPRRGERHGRRRSRPTWSSSSNQVINKSCAHRRNDAE